MNYQIIALDIDGTVRNSKKEISFETRKLLLELQEQGIIVAIASGRCTYGVAPTAKELCLDRFGGYILSYNSGQVINCKTKQIIENHYLPLNLIGKIFDFAASIHGDLLIYHEPYVISNNIKNPYVQNEGRIHAMELKQTENFQEFNQIKLNECLIAAEPEILKKALPKAKQLFGGVANIFRAEPYLLTFVPPGIEKGNGLKAILERHQIPREASIAFGDGYNDISMLKYAGLGVAMGNAEAPIKEAADFVTKSCDEDGIVYALHRFLHLPS